MPPARNQQDQVFLQIVTEFKETSSEIGSLRQELKTLKESIDPIFKIIRGDGTVQSLVTQIELGKQQLGYMAASITKAETKIKELTDLIDKSDAEDKKGRWTVLAALITGGMGLLAAAIALIITLMKK